MFCLYSIILQTCYVNIELYYMGRSYRILWNIFVVLAVYMSLNFIYNTFLNFNYIVHTHIH